MLITCFDIHCDNQIEMPDYNFDHRSKLRFCWKCRKTKNNAGSNIPIVWVCEVNNCENLLITPSFNLSQNKCHIHKRGTINYWNNLKKNQVIKND